MRISDYFLSSSDFFVYAGFIPNLKARDVDVDGMLMNLLFISEEFFMDKLRYSIERLLLQRLNMDNAPSIFMAVKDNESNQKLALACAMVIMREIKSDRKHIGANVVDKRAENSSDDSNDDCSYPPINDTDNCNYNNEDGCDNENGDG